MRLAKISVWLAPLWLASCASAPSPKEPHPSALAPASGGCPDASGVPAAPRTRPLPAKTCGRLTLPPGAAPDAGQLVLSWFTPAEHARFEDGLPGEALALSLVTRARIVPGAKLDAGIVYSIDHAPGDVVVFALFDQQQAFWPTVFGRGTGNFVGAGRGDFTLREQPEALRQPERCTGERNELFIVEAPEVVSSGSLARRLCVSLPRSYAKQRRRRYPVVYLLPPLAGADTAYLSGTESLRAQADTLGEMILVGVDTRIRQGNTYFTNSPTAGEWARFVETRLVEAIDGRYRTLARREARSLVGHGAGGFAAVSVALRFPELFGSAAASSPDALDLEGWLLGERHRVQDRWLAWARLERGLGGIGRMASFGASFTPDLVQNNGYRLPFDLETGELLRPDWERWIEQSPLEILKRGVEPLPEIRISLPAEDPLALRGPALRFATALRALGAEPEVSESKTRPAALEAALGFVHRRMPAAEP